VTLCRNEQKWNRSVPLRREAYPLHYLTNPYLATTRCRRCSRYWRCGNEWDKQDLPVTQRGGRSLVPETVRGSRWMNKGCRCIGLGCFRLQARPGFVFPMKSRVSGWPWWLKPVIPATDWGSGDQRDCGWRLAWAKSSPDPISTNDLACWCMVWHPSYTGSINRRNTEQIGPGKKWDPISK
jgi:hypothetical protein